MTPVAKEVAITLNGWGHMFSGDQPAALRWRQLGGLVFPNARRLTVRFGEPEHVFTESVNVAICNADDFVALIRTAMIPSLCRVAFTGPDSSHVSAVSKSPALSGLVSGLSVGIKRVELPSCFLELYPPVSYDCFTDVTHLVCEDVGDSAEDIIYIVNCNAPALVDLRVHGLPSTFAHELVYDEVGDYFVYECLKRLELGLVASEGPAKQFVAGAKPFPGLKSLELKGEYPVYQDVWYERLIREIPYVKYTRA
ncbi:hypothetical protein IWW38_003429 [Coemansia aciculifera]|uniref:Uncharacterized protein n=1 Tax=Coemansia aciculifera TaxID=417176 RepID=A0ACC1M1H5_9FUNG|nr:hypothetical protein IWW38_003429 [Coemansia aciculifera]